MLLLCMLRHGPAATGDDDPPLSDSGLRLMEGAARGMIRIGFSFDAIYASPLRRAAQTASVVAEAAGKSGGWRALPEAGPGARIGSLATALSRLGASGTVLIVGHQPDMGQMAMRTIGAKAAIPFDKGTLCVVQGAGWEALASGGGTIMLLVGAPVLAALGEKKGDATFGEGR